jgi:NAD(P)-dependent dehydrogenase (short-subunit alcohol dehydrogenase family)
MGAEAMKIAAVTGGAQGIGRAIAYAFARAGYAVSTLDPVEDAGLEAVDKIGELGSQGVYVQGGTASEADIEAWIERTAKVLGCPDVLVNNAGIMVRKPFLELPVDDFDRVIATNLRGAFLCSQKVARLMVAEKKRGSIVNIASTRAFMSEPGTESYTASKGGIAALTHGMAVSLGPHGIRVNAISPGWIETRDWQFSGRAETPHHSQEDKEQHPVGRVGNPEDIAEACLFLAKHGGFITGQNLVIDGGMTIKMIYKD